MAINPWTWNCSMTYGITHLTLFMFSSHVSRLLELENISVNLRIVFYFSSLVLYLRMVLYLCELVALYIDVVVLLLLKHLKKKVKKLRVIWARKLHCYMCLTNWPFDWTESIQIGAKGELLQTLDVIVEYT